MIGTRYVWYCQENDELYDYGYFMHKELHKYLLFEPKEQWVFLGIL